MSYIDQTIGISIFPISSMLMKPSVTQCKLTMSAPLALISDAEMLEKRAGDRHVVRGDLWVRQSCLSIRLLDLNFRMLPCATVGSVEFLTATRIWDWTPFAISARWSEYAARAAPPLAS
jgi:hypothetical protein